MMNFGRLESLMYDCRMNLYWRDGYDFIDLRDAKVAKIEGNEIVLYDEKENLYWHYEIDSLEAKLDSLKDIHANEFKSLFRMSR